MQQKQRQITACAFDLGNTLIHDTLVTREATQKMADRLVRQRVIDSKKAFITTYTTINYSIAEPFISHTFGELEFFERTFQELHITAMTPEDALQQYRTIVKTYMRPDQDVIAAFQFLQEQEIQIALLSNERVARVEMYLEQTGMRPFFETIVVSEGVGVEKPDLRIFQEVLDRLQIPGAELAMFGDNDIADGACKQLGCTFVLVTGYRNADWIWEQGDPHQPDYMIEKVTRPALQAFLQQKEC